jgi:hypothetical protein
MVDVTRRIYVDLRPEGFEVVSPLSPWAIQRALWEAIEPGASSHCMSTRHADQSIPPSGMYVSYHARLDTEIVVDDRTQEER